MKAGVKCVEEYRTFDKTDWERGPWDDEPDKAVWVDDDTELDCMIVRNRRGALCGYVGVGPDHPMHGKDIRDVDLRMHGGLTFASGCAETVNLRAIARNALHKYWPQEASDTEGEPLDAADKTPGALIVAAWGASKPKGIISRALLHHDLGNEWLCYGHTSGRAPRHPSRLPYDTKLVKLR